MYSNALPLNTSLQAPSKYFDVKYLLINKQISGFRVHILLEDLKIKKFIHSGQNLLYLLILLCHCDVKDILGTEA